MPRCKACGKEISEGQSERFNQLCMDCEHQRAEIEQHFLGDEEELGRFWYLWAIFGAVGFVLALIYFILYPFL